MIRGKVNWLFKYVKLHKYLITCLGGALVIGIIDDNSVYQRLKLQMRLNEVTSELEECRQQYERDSIRLSALHANRKGVERVARERYFMKRADEDVFVLSSDESLEDNNVGGEK